MPPDSSSPRPLARSGSRRPARSGWPRAGTPWRLAAVAGALAAGLAVMVAQAPSAPAAPATRAASATPLPQVRSQACPQYSDAVLTALGVGGNTAAFRTLWARTQCGTLQVPLDYASPHGRQITIAFTRLPATDQAHRLGSLALNPGGPGGSGYLMPVQLTLPGAAAAGLNTRYDLLGIDLRGIGYSSKLACSQAPSGSRDPALTEAQAREVYDAQAAANRACVAQDPAFMAQETTANAARDLNQLRIALHQDKLSYLGLSWGTALGAVYRSLFPATAGRMWLDSVVAPVDTIGAGIAARTAAMQRDFGRFAAWIAARNSSYGFGTTEAQVSAALLAMSRALDATPVTFTDINQPIDGSLVALLSSESSPHWPGAAEVFKELRDATSGTTAPPAVKQLFTTQPAPAGVPEQDNRTAGLALTCNALPASFAAYWQAHQLTLARQPLLDGRAPFGAQCAGWPLPVRPLPLRHTATPLEMSGHRWESTTPYPWAKQMQSLIGGNLFTVNDDVHADAPATPDCAARIVGYFDTGMSGTGQCTGSPVPTSPAPGQQPTVPAALAPAAAGTPAWTAGT
jgi:pimeloyl-ACP methyl ester carboxylesterase